MKKLIFLPLFLLFTSTVFAQEKPQWIRYQTISPDGNHIAFTYKGDLYRVSAEGGVARQLTFHEAHDFMPVWSNDGEKIAFASDRYGNFNVFVMSAEGGPAQRVTFHSNDEYPYTFSHDDEYIIFGAVRQDHADHRQFPAASQPELYQVPVIGGRVGQLFTIPAEDVQVSHDGNLIVYHDKKGGENEWRKHHRSSITRDIWLYDAETDTHNLLTTFDGEDRNPVFGSNKEYIYYLSEESGNSNVHRMALGNPGESEQITHFTGHPVRFLSHANGTLAFGYRGGKIRDSDTVPPGNDPFPPRDKMH